MRGIRITTVFAAAVNAIVSSRVFPAAFIAAAELSSESPTPFELIAKLFNLLLSHKGTDRINTADSHFWLSLTFQG